MVAILVTLLIGTTIVSALEYYRKIRRAEREYEKAKSAVDDILSSFNRQFRSENEKLEALSYKVEAVGARGEGVLGSMKEVNKNLSVLQNKVELNRQDTDKIVSRMDIFEKVSRDIAASQEAMASKIVGLEQQAKQLSALPEAVFEGAIPIRREKAMAQLTSTEVSVLGVLASEGPKTAPEIGKRMRLSREHTARLMKKLYEAGYLERETGKIPFKYSVKKEMEKLLQKAESQTVQGTGELNSS